MRPDPRRLACCADAGQQIASFLGGEGLRPLSIHWLRCSRCLRSTDEASVPAPGHPELRLIKLGRFGTPAGRAAGRAFPQPHPTGCEACTAAAGSLVAAGVFAHRLCWVSAPGHCAGVTAAGKASPGRACAVPSPASTAARRHNSATSRRRQVHGAADAGPHGLRSGPADASHARESRHAPGLQAPVVRMTGLTQVFLRADTGSRPRPAARGKVRAVGGPLGQEGAQWKMAGDL